MCVDSRDRTYEYGEFKRTRTFDDCADVCVKDVPSSLLSSFRGIDFDCKEETCRCLYDSGTLSNRNSGRFDRTSTRERGDGSIASSTVATNSLKSVSSDSPLIPLHAYILRKV